MSSVPSFERFVSQLWKSMSHADGSPPCALDRLLAALLERLAERQALGRALLLGGALYGLLELAERLVPTSYACSAYST